jgi:hypothetical protein
MTVTMDVETEGMAVLVIVSVTTEVEAGAWYVSMVVPLTAHIQLHADEYCSRLRHWDAMGNSGVGEEIVDGAEDAEDATVMESSEDSEGVVVDVWLDLPLQRFLFGPRFFR